MPYKKIEDATKALVIGHLLSGMMPARISEETGVSEATISRLKRDIPEELWNSFETKRANLEAERAEFEKEKVSVAALVEQHLRQSLTAATEIMKQTSDKEWLNNQSASELALLYGVGADKTFRILEAIQRADERREAVKAHNSHPACETDSSKS